MPTYRNDTDRRITFVVMKPGVGKVLAPGLRLFQFFTLLGFKLFDTLFWCWQVFWHSVTEFRFVFFLLFQRNDIRSLARGSGWSKDQARGKAMTKEQEGR